MSLILLDTNIISFLIKGDSRAEAYQQHVVGNEPAVSLMTVAELFQWAAIRQWSDRRTAELESYILERYTILPVNLTPCRLWGAFRAEAQKAGRPISPQNAWIAATAVQYDLPWLTHNPADFPATPRLRVISALS